MRTLKLMIMATGAAMLLTACDVKDPIYTTPHPNHGKITLTTDWNATNLSQSPAKGYTVVVGDYKATVTANPATLNDIFSSGTYTGYVYTAANGITVSGTGSNTTASVATVTAPEDPMNPGNLLPGRFVDPVPEFFYAGTKEVTIEADKGYDIVVEMRQQVRELTIILANTDVANKITCITATLSGVAGAWNLETDEASGDAVSIAPVFTKQSDGKWKATVRLLGIAGSSQMLAGRISFNGSDDITFSEDLHDMEAFAAFNTDKKTPLKIDVNGVQTIASEADLRRFSAEWKAAYVAGDKEATWAAQYDMLQRWSIDAAYTPGTLPTGTVSMSGNIDMAADNDDSPFDPIGHIQDNPFNVTFDGKGHKISNLKITGEDGIAAGLFGYATGEIKNLHIVSGEITGNQYLGAIAGRMTTLNPGDNQTGNETGIGKITDCSNAATVTGTGRAWSAMATGGIVGYLGHLSAISGCTNRGKVNGVDDTGGIAGHNSGSTVQDCNNEGGVGATGDDSGGICGYVSSGLVWRCHNTGQVKTSGEYVGGIAGQMGSAGRIGFCSNAAAVDGKSSVGGVCGTIGATASTYAYIVSSFNTGDVTATGNYAGGVIGQARRTVTACYNTGAVKGGRYVGGVAGYMYGANPSTTISACYNTGAITASSSYGTGGIIGNRQSNIGSSTTVIESLFWVDVPGDSSDKAVGGGMADPDNTLRFGINEPGVSGWPASTDAGWGTGDGSGTHPDAGTYWKAPLQDYNTAGKYPRLSWE